ncbi:MAG: acetolactate synthase [Clostridia bacterium]|nr:acetolactate synthase [Clostridia bacterium]
MAIRQMSVFVDNKQGELAKLLALLAEYDVDIKALVLGDSADFGILRFVSAHTDLAAQVLKDHGYIHSQTMVVAACVDDRPGGLAVQLQSLADNGINIEYLYAFVTTEVHEACVVLRVNNNEAAEAALGGMGVRLLSEEDIAAL